MTKHIPMRMCVTCRTMRPQSELIRIVCGENDIQTDENKKLFGRGAYICRDEKCIKAAAKKNLLARHFKRNVGMEIYAKAEELING